MNDEFAELVKKNMLHRFLFLGIERAYFKKGTTTFSGYAIKVRDKDSLLFISDTEDYSFHSAHSIFGGTYFMNRCLWLGEVLLIHPRGGMLI